MLKFDDVLGEVVDLSDSLTELYSVSLEDLLISLN